MTTPARNPPPPRGRTTEPIGARGARVSITRIVTELRTANIDRIDADGKVTAIRRHKSADRHPRCAEDSGGKDRPGSHQDDGRTVL